MTPLIIIAETEKRAKDWADEGRLPRLSYIIITDANNCNRKLKGMSFTYPLLVARVGNAPRDWQYIDDFIKAKTIA